MTEREQKIVDKIHEYEFEMLCKFDDVCRAHNITYFIDGGTLIGAVRHKDFVPWDDDIDIYIKRKDYEKLLQYRDELEPYFIHVPNPDDTSFWDFTDRLMDKRIKFKKDDKEARFYNHIHCQYLFFDLFIMDNMPNGWFSRKKHIFILKLLYVFATSRRYKMKYLPPKNPINKLAVTILCRIGMYIPLQKIFKWYNKEAQKYNKDKLCTSYLLSNASAFFISRCVYKKEWYRTKTELPIRGRNFYVPGKYDETLRNYYGDYMQLPPEEERYPEHIELFDDVMIEGVSVNDMEL